MLPDKYHLLNCVHQLVCGIFSPAIDLSGSCCVRRGIPRSKRKPRIGLASTSATHQVLDDDAEDGDGQAQACDRTEKDEGVDDKADAVLNDLHWSSFRRR